MFNQRPNNQKFSFGKAAFAALGIALADVLTKDLDISTNFLLQAAKYIGGSFVGSVAFGGIFGRGEAVITRAILSPERAASMISTLALSSLLGREPSNAGLLACVYY